MAKPSTHPLNQGFTWRRQDREPRRLTTDLIDRFDRQGFAVLPDALSPASVDQLLADIDPVEERAAALLSRRRHQTVPTTEWTITSHLVLRSAAARLVCGSGILAEVAVDLLGAGARLYWDQSVYKKPHSTLDFAWHQDNGKVFVEPQQYLTCWIALTDTNEDNGCPIIAVGSHTAGTLEHWQGPMGWTCLDGDTDVEAVPVPMRAGSVAVFSSVTVHKTHPNRTGRTRKAYVVQYAPADAVALDVREDGTVHRVPQDDPLRQFVVPLEDRSVT